MTNTLTILSDGASGPAQGITALTLANAVIPTTKAILCGTAGSIIRTNGAPSINPANATSNAIGGLQVGNTIAGITATNNLFTLLVYGASHTLAQMQSIDAAILAPYAPPRNWTKKLIYGGSSLITSYRSSGNQTAPWQGGFGAGANGNVADWQVEVMASSGRSLATELASVAVYTGLYDASKSKNVVVLDAPHNDLTSPFASSSAATTAANTAFNNTLLPGVVTLKAKGQSVVVPTMVAAANFDTTTNFYETYRLAYNALVVAGAAANGYIVADRAGWIVGGVAIFNSPAAATNLTYYYGDGVHLVNAGYAQLEIVDKAAILSA